jgi:hypothetical protein
MKKIIMTLGALFSISIAIAQTDPKQVPQPTQTPATPMPPKTEIKDKPVTDEEIQNDAVSKEPKPAGEVQPRKDEIKTQNHVKSTSRPEAVTDTVKTVRKDKKTKRQ